MEVLQCQPTLHSRSDERPHGGDYVQFVHARRPSTARDWLRYLLATLKADGPQGSRRNTMSRAGTGRSRSAASGGQSSSAANTITAQETSHEYRPSAVDGILAEQGLERYHLRPPTWRAPWIVEQPDRPDAATGKNAAPAQSVGFEAGKPLIRLAGAPALLPVPGSSGAVGAAVTGSDTGAAVGSGSSGTTWPVFYPPHDGMDEDRLTEHVVKQGFAAKSLVQVRRSRFALLGLPRADLRQVRRPRRSLRISISTTSSRRAMYSETSQGWWRPSERKRRRGCLYTGSSE